MCVRVHVGGRGGGKEEYLHVCKGACGRERGREGGIFACVQGCMWEGEDVRGCTGEGGLYVCGCTGEEYCVCVYEKKTC